MSWRPLFSGRLILPRSAAVAVVSCAVLVASCGSDRGRIDLVASPKPATSTVITVSTTVPEATTTIAVDSTVAPDTAPPSAPSETPPTVPSAPTDPGGGPAPQTVRPPAAWIGFGVPQPGSMFENLHEDHALDGKGKFVALTFDDGPSQYTQPILDILNAAGVKATFFQIEQQSIARQNLVKQMLADGMHIGSHSKHHPHLNKIPPAAQDDEVTGSIDSLNATFGEGTVKCFRPPYAQYNQHVLDLVAQRGDAVAMWSLDSLDWKKPPWQSLVTRVVNGAQDRNVLLFHDGGGDRAQTIAALPWIIQGLRDKGFQFIQVC